MRARTVSARRISSPAMMTGLSIGRLTAIGSMYVMGTLGAPLGNVIPGPAEARNPESRIQGERH